MGLFLVWCHILICIVLSLCKHACKEVCEVKQGIDPYPLLARSCDKWWPDFVTFTACKRSIFGLKGGKKAQCVSNRCKDLFKRKKSYFGSLVYIGSYVLIYSEHSRSWTNHRQMCIRCHAMTIYLQLKQRKMITSTKGINWQQRYC